jgi:hypothetical protein
MLLRHTLENGNFMTVLLTVIILLLLLLLLLLALQPTVGFSLLSNFLPFRHFLTQFSPPSYSHTLSRFREGGPVSVTEFFATF